MVLCAIRSIFSSHSVIRAIDISGRRNNWPASGMFCSITADRSPKKEAAFNWFTWWLPPRSRHLPEVRDDCGLSRRYKASTSLPPRKCVSSSDSLLTGINLLLSLVVPLDFANQVIGDGHRIFWLPSSMRCMYGFSVS